MSNEQPPQTPIDIQYESPPQDGNAPTLIQLATIFGFVSCGFDLLYVLGNIGMGIMMFLLMKSVPPPPPPATPDPPWMQWMPLIMYGTMALLSLLAMIPKLMGTLALLRMKKRAWGLGLTMGIVSCCEIWMLSPCCAYIIPLAAGVFTIVILSLPHVREYIARKQEQAT